MCFTFAWPSYQVVRRRQKGRAEKRNENVTSRERLEFGRVRREWYVLLHSRRDGNGRGRNKRRARRGVRARSPRSTWWIEYGRNRREQVLPHRLAARDEYVHFPSPSKSNQILCWITITAAAAAVNLGYAWNKYEKKTNACCLCLPSLPAEKGTSSSTLFSSSVASSRWTSCTSSPVAMSATVVDSATVVGTPLFMLVASWCIFSARCWLRAAGGGAAPTLRAGDTTREVARRCCRRGLRHTTRTRNYALSTRTRPHIDDTRGANVVSARRECRSVGHFAYTARSGSGSGSDMSGARHTARQHRTTQFSNAAHMRDADCSCRRAWNTRTPFVSYTYTRTGTLGMRAPSSLLRAVRCATTQPTFAWGAWGKYVHNATRSSLNSLLLHAFPLKSPDPDNPNRKQ